MKQEDINKLNDVLGRMRAVQTGMEDAPSARERKQMTTELNTLERQVRKLQGNVLKSYNPTFITCRDIGHNWQETENGINEFGDLSRVLTCDRCDTERHESFTRFGELVHRHYQHADEYLLDSNLKSGIGFSKAFWRGIQYMQAAREQ